MELSIFDKAVKATVSQVEAGAVDGVTLETLVVVEGKDGKLFVDTVFNLACTVERNSLRWAYATHELEAEYPELFV